MCGPIIFVLFGQTHSTTGPYCIIPKKWSAFRYIIEQRHGRIKTQSHKWYMWTDYSRESRNVEEITYCITLTVMNRSLAPGEALMFILLTGHVGTCRWTSQKFLNKYIIFPGLMRFHWFIFNLILSLQQKYKSTKIYYIILLIKRYNIIIWSR